MPAPRTIALGDIHGCHTALELVLDRLQLTAGDTLVVLGDIVDRGPGSKQAIDLMLELQQNCRVVFLLGNHEEMMLGGKNGDSIEKMWLRYGGWETLSSYGGGYGLVPDSHWEFLESALPYWETDSEIFLHANLEPGVPLPKQTGEWLRWTRLSGQEKPHECGRRAICGHTSLSQGIPWILEGWVCIDTWCYGGEYLTALDVTNDLVYQSKQTRETRGPLPLSDFLPAVEEGQETNSQE